MNKDMAKNGIKVNWKRSPGFEKCKKRKKRPEFGQLPPVSIGLHPRTESTVWLGGEPSGPKLNLTQSHSQEGLCPTIVK